MPNIFRSHLQRSILSALLVISAHGFSDSSISVFAQNSGVPHGKATGIPEKKPDGTWESLKPNQQKILAPLEDDWNYTSPDSRKKWILLANLYPKMTELDQQRLQSRMASWSNLSQRDRRVARENYLSSLKFPAEKKAEAWSSYQKLSDEQKKKLAEAEVKKKPTATSSPSMKQYPVNPTPTSQLPVRAPKIITPTETIPSPPSASSPSDTPPTNN